LRQVKIEYRKLEAPPSGQTGVGTTFSGGVDSFFALQKHSPATQPSPEYQITHALFIYGFDIPQKEKSKYDELFARYQPLLQTFGVDLVPLETNIISMIVPHLSIPKFYGASLAGCAMSLSGLFKRFIISSSWDYNFLKKRDTSSNPLSDRLLSTESMDIEHFGANYRRVDKVRAISNWEVAQGHLRVCGQANLESGVINCSRCGKCIRTMIPLYIFGKLDQFSSFNRKLQSDRDIMRWARKFDSDAGYVSETFEFVKSHKRQMLPWLVVATILGKMRLWAIRVLPHSVKNRLQRYGYFIDHLSGENVFENPEVNAIIEEQVQ
jgi:hypothetical protein